MVWIFANKIDFIITNFKELNEKINYNAQKMMREEYAAEKFGMHYYEIFNNLEGIETE